MQVNYAPKGLIGVLTPQANTTVEPELAIMMPPGFAWINARLTSDKPGIEATEVRHARRRSMLDELRQPQKSKAHASAAATSPETHVLLPPDAAERVQELDPIAVRFWARTGHPIGYIAEPAS